MLGEQALDQVALLLLSIAHDAHVKWVQPIFYSGPKTLKRREDRNALSVGRPHLDRLPFEELPAVYEVAFAMLPVECLIVVHFKLICENVFLKSLRSAHEIVIRQPFAWIGFFKQINPPQIDLLASEEIAEFRKVHEPANDCFERGFDTRGMGNDGHVTSDPADRTASACSRS